MNRRALLTLLIPLLIAAGVIALSPTPAPSGGNQDWITILSGRFTADETTVEECPDAENQKICYAQAFGNIALSEGGGEAMRRLLGASVLAQDELSDCHSVAHMIGTASYYALDKDFGAAIAAGSRECAGGYYHGVAAAEVASNPSGSPEELGSRIGTLCYRASRTAPDINGASSKAGVMNECVHGIGHVAQHAYDYDIPTALLACDSMLSTIELLDTSSTERRDSFFTCAQGVFMENRQAGGGPEGKWLRSDDPAYPCSEFDDEEVGTSCWDTVPGAVIVPDGMEGDQTVALTSVRFDLCATAKLEAWRDRCIEITRRSAIVGEDMTSETYRAVCLLDPIGVPVCLRAIGSEMMLRNSSVELGAIVCAAAQTPDETEACGLGIGQGLRYVPLPVELCDEFLPALVAPCRRGYQLP